MARERSAAAAGLPKNAEFNVTPAFIGTVNADPSIQDVIHVGDLATLAIIAALLAAGVGASLVADRLDPPHPAAKAVRRPPRCPTELQSPA